MKKILCLVMILVLALSIGFSAFAEEYPDLKQKPDGDISVGFLVHNLVAEYNRRCYQAVKVEAAHRGWELTDVVINSDEEGVAAIKTMINKGVDAIVISNMDMPAFGSAIIEARQAGIGVYCVDTEVLEGCISNALACNGVATAKMAYMIASDLNWKGRYCILKMPSVQVHNERINPVTGIWDCYSGMEFVAEEYITFTDVDVGTQAYNYAKRWAEKYGDTIDVIFCSWDGAAIGAANAWVETFPDTDIITAGVDGGSEVWAYIRNGSPVKYSYAQPVELYYHTTMELIVEMQVNGLKPGDEGCTISQWGESIWCDGEIVTPDNVPEVGQPIHAAVGFYGCDPDDADAWYNWTDADGFPMITDN